MIRSLSALTRELVRWLGSRDLVMLVAALAVVLGVWAFIAIADEMAEGDTQRFDEWAVRSLRDPADPLDPLGPPWLEEMGREWAHIDVVRDRAQRSVVAFSNYWLVADEVHLLNLATLPVARRAGHASRLLAHIIEEGRRASCRFVTLEVRRSNAAASRLYRRFGFRAVGVRPNYYAEDQEDAIVMLLDLA